MIAADPCPLFAPDGATSFGFAEGGKGLARSWNDSPTLF